MHNSTPSIPVLYLRSFVFWVFFASITVIFAPLLLLSFPLPFRKRFSLTYAWSKLTIWWLGVSCKLYYEVQGRENIKHKAGVVFSKHQSTWETLTLNFWFTPQTWVLKRELLWLPFFGWGAYMMEPIALNRGSGRRAVEQLVEQGQQRLDNGRWVIIFPEGTRIPPGKRGRYRIGGAVLAERTGYPIYPVAHNAGEYWPRRQFIKKPGVIQVRIGPAISPHGKTPQQLSKEAEDWIESEMVRITTLGTHEHDATTPG